MATSAEGLPRGRPEDRPAPATGVGTPVLLALIWLVGASGALLLYWGSKLTFFLDDWEFLLYRSGFDAQAILTPHGEHIAVAPILIYKALLATAGMGSALPFRVVSTATFLLSAVLLFACLRPRLGQLPALAGTAIVLFLGAAWEDLLWPFQIGYFGSMAAGLGALLALQREDRGGDRIACLALSASILFSSLGIPFAVAGLVAVMRRADRWRRLYVVAVPALLYAVWWLGWGHDAESSLTLTHIAQTPLFVLDGIAASLASALGLLSGSSGGLVWGRPLAVAAIALALWRLYRFERVPYWLWVVLALGASFWILAGFNQIAGRTPIASRYQYIGVVFLFLIAAELARGVRLGPLAVAIVLAVSAGSLAGNISYLRDAYAGNYRPASQLEKASLGALDIARDTVEPGFALDEELTGTGYVHVEAGPYFAAEDRYGTPAYTAAEIAAAPEPGRFAADKVLFAALGMELRPAGTAAAPAPAAAPDAEGTIPIPAGACVTVPSDGATSPLLALPPAGARIRAGDGPIGTIRMRRFAATEFPIEMVNGVAPGGAATIAIPPDRAALPWKIQLETAAATTVCGRGAPANEGDE